VDDFGVKYVGKENVEHLIQCLKGAKYKLTKDWSGSLYCGISIDWNYKEGYVDISMPGYVKKKLHEIQTHTPCPHANMPILTGAQDVR
jgi:endonuclease I